MLMVLRYIMKWNMGGDQQVKKIELKTAVAFAVGAMIGGGVFVLSGVALNKTGPSAIISFLIAGIMVLLSALSFAVIASNNTSKDSGYAYVGESLGSPIWGFLTSWCFYLAGIIGAAFVLNAFGTYVHQFIFHNISIVIWALVGAVILTVVNLGPASEIGKIESLLVSVKLFILLILVLFGLGHISSSNFHPFMSHGSSQILATSAFLFIAFLGFNVITSISSDIDEPTKTIPQAILASMLIVTVVYLGVVIALLAAHIHSYSEASVGVAAKRLIGPIGGGLIIIGALISTLSSANANILGSSEIMLRLASDGEVPTSLGKMKHGHPYVSVLLGAVLYALLLISNQTTVIIGLANVMAILALIIVNIAAAKTLTRPGYQGYTLPFGPMIPILGALGAAIQFLFIGYSVILMGFLLSLSGIGIYMLRKRYHRPALRKELMGVIDRVEGPLGRVFYK
jgi:APA family basic amino acid/polyamine antiporter